MPLPPADIPAFHSPLNIESLTESSLGLTSGWRWQISRRQKYLRKSLKLM